MSEYPDKRVSNTRAENRASSVWAFAAPISQAPIPILVWIIVVAVGIALALVPLEALTTIVYGGVALGLALAQPVFGLYFAVLSVPVQEAWHLPGGLSYTQAAMALAVGAWGLRVLAHPEARIVKGRLLACWCFLLWALLLSSALTPYSTNLALKETLRWAEAFVIWLIAVNTVKRRWHIVGLIMCLLLAPLAEAAYGLYQFATGDGPTSFQISANLPFVRAYGTHGQPNSFAGYMNMAWPLAVALAVGTTWLWLQGRTPNEQQHIAPHAAQSSFFARHRALLLGIAMVGAWSIAGTLLAALVASFSRGAWLGAIIGLFGMAFALGRRARWGVLALVVVLVLVLVASGTGVLPNALATRINSITSSLSYFDPSTVQIIPQNFAAVERMAHIQAGLRMFLAHPLVGVGTGNFSSAFPDVASPPWYVSRGHAHNYYLHMAAEAGAIGLLAYLLLIGTVVRQALGLLRRTRAPFRRSIVVGCCGVIACVAGHNLFENLHALSMGIQIAAIWALVSVPGLGDAGLSAEESG